MVRQYSFFLMHCLLGTSSLFSMKSDDTYCMNTEDNQRVSTARAACNIYEKIYGNLAPEQRLSLYRLILYERKRFEEPVFYKTVRMIAPIGTQMPLLPLCYDNQWLNWYFPNPLNTHELIVGHEDSYTNTITHATKAHVRAPLIALAVGSTVDLQVVLAGINAAALMVCYARQQCKWREEHVTINHVQALTKLSSDQQYAVIHTLRGCRACSILDLHKKKLGRYLYHPRLTFNAVSRCAYNPTYSLLGVTGLFEGNACLAQFDMRTARAINVELFEECINNGMQLLYSNDGNTLFLHDILTLQAWELDHRIHKYRWSFEPESFSVRRALIPHTDYTLTGQSYLYGLNDVREVGLVDTNHNTIHSLPIKHCRSLTAVSQEGKIVALTGKRNVRCAFYNQLPRMSLEHAAKQVVESDDLQHVSMSANSAGVA